MVVKLLAPESTGASLTLVTVIWLVAVAVLKAVVPPLTLVSTFEPALPLVWSQAQKVTLAVVPFWPSGMKLGRAVGRGKRSEELLTLPTLFQVLPPSVEYCQAPVLLLMLVTAMPCTAPLSTSVIFPETKVATESPVLFV